LPSRFHNDRGNFIQDVGIGSRVCPVVFVSNHFYYFGDKRVKICEKFATVIHHGQGIHYTRYHELAKRFVKWLEDKYKPGARLGEPQDDPPADTGPMITDLIADCAGQAQKQERTDCPPKSQTISETRLP
jgi:hypothetical protein